MRISLFGPARAHRDDGTSVSLGGARLRALLAALALRPGHTTGAGALIAEVWDDDPPADAAGALQALVARLRRALGAGAVTSVDGGYRLAATRDDVDLFRFERLVADGARALDDGDPAKAAALLDDALALWTGPPLADLPARTGEAARCGALRDDAIRLRLTAGLALGRAERVLPELAALCAEQPLNEALHTLHIRALRDAGRTADALDAYGTVRAAIADRLGTDPGPELRALHGELLRGTSEPPLRAKAPAGHRGASPAGASPSEVDGRSGTGLPGSGNHSDGSHSDGSLSGGGSHSGGNHSVGSHPGSGTGRPGPAHPDASAGSAHPAAPADPGSTHSAASADPGPAHAPRPAPTSGPAHDPGSVQAPGSAHAARPGAVPPEAPGRPGGNLRARLTSFVGREADLRGIGEDLAAARLVTLTGPGGSGKTRLSQEAADRFGERWPGEVWLAELAPVAEGATVAEAVLNALGLREIALHSTADKALAAEPRDPDPVRTLTEYCAGRRLLLVLDNCEHVIDACAALAERLLTHCPGVTVLATSREPLGVPGELTRPVDPLPVPTALRLLADRGAAARPGFTPDDDPGACAEICRRLDGLPLAIELAAARLRILTPRQIAERLDDRFRLLTAGSRTVLPRQQTLRAVVDWSWDLLEPAERALLRRLSVFSGGCDLTAAEAVCAGGGVEPLDVAALLGALVDKSLVVADFSAPAARYRTLETIGEYAADRLTESGERDAVERRHLSYFREYARTADPYLRGPEQLRWLELFEREHDNLRAALRRAVDAADEPEALQLALACVWFWMMRNYRTEIRSWLPAVAALGPDPFAVPRPALLPLDLTPLEVELPFPPGQLDEARRWIRTAGMAVWEESLDHLARGDDREFGAAVIAAYPPHLPQSGARPGLVRPFAAFLTGDFDRLIVLLDELVDACRAHGRVWELAFALQLRAKALDDRAGERDFMGDVRESRELFARVGDRWGMAEALSAQAESVSRRGDWQDTARCCREAMALARELGAHQQVPELTVRLGEAVLNGGDPQEGERLLRAGVDEGLRMGQSAIGAVFHGRISLVACLCHQGRLAEAGELVDLMLEPATTLPQELVRGVLLCVKGWLAARADHGDRGLELARAGLDDLYAHPLAEIFVPRIGMVILPVVTALLTRVAEHDPAAADPRTPVRARHATMLLAVNRGVRPNQTVPLERAEMALAETVCRAVLGDDAYTAAYAEGGGLTPQEAAALVRDALN
ncbi:AfsR/SARP family transcriptional regulator [Streptantibioticus silvisoli]|uniref:BTAD domain-containing putative transcriptional regulator n=1 Tax=Streptantibioticus silvisoli TaxID=2705255 RepID=A0ABT6VT42_9ACTN|nr:BTAD domain-containing putative transcriptional regulator [Streptantibioticus silvisoli]MDI5961640.1 BTAD domain-containing putative transcriptional regulator [Streptantibioticus silvisoli]